MYCKLVIFNVTIFGGNWFFIKLAALDMNWHNSDCTYSYTYMNDFKWYAVFQQKWWTEYKFKCYTVTAFPNSNFGFVMHFISRLNGVFGRCV